MRLRAACLALLLAACGPKTPTPPATPALSPEQQFAALERRYVIFVLQRYPVVSTYLGGSEFDPTLADNDGRLRDYSADALKEEDARLGEFREQFTRLDPNTLSPDGSIALSASAPCAAVRTMSEMSCPSRDQVRAKSV